MRYLLIFAEGIASFISPCMLPMLPIYLTYFAGEKNEKGKVLPRALAFVAGFTVIFCLMGVLAGTLGAFLRRYRAAVNIVCGLLVILFGLSCMDIVPLKFLRGMKDGRNVDGIVSAFLFGIVFSLNLTPCIGAYLGAALMMAATVGGAWQGLSLLLVYALGLGIPLIASALLIDRLKGAFGFIRRHYRAINIVCGVFLIAVGLTIMLGKLEIVLSLFM